jgi:hypothetical protein
MSWRHPATPLSCRGDQALAAGSETKRRSVDGCVCLRNSPRPCESRSHLSGFPSVNGLAPPAWQWRLGGEECLINTSPSGQRVKLLTFNVNTRINYSLRTTAPFITEQATLQLDQSVDNFLADTSFSSQFPIKSGGSSLRTSHSTTAAGNSRRRQRVFSQRTIGCCCLIQRTCSHHKLAAQTSNSLQLATTTFNADPCFFRKSEYYFTPVMEPPSGDNQPFSGNS